jgi:hypothetical protein
VGRTINCSVCGKECEVYANERCRKCYYREYIKNYFKTHPKAYKNNKDKCREYNRKKTGYYQRKEGILPDLRGKWKR